MKSIKIQLLNPDAKVKSIKFVRSLGMFDCSLKDAKRFIEGTLVLPLKNLDLHTLHELLCQSDFRLILDDARLFPLNEEEHALTMKILWHREREKALLIELAKIKKITKNP